MTNEEMQLKITKYDLLFESRLTKVEIELTGIGESVKEIKSDMRWMFGILLGTYAVLMGLIAKGFHWY